MGSGQAIKAGSAFVGLSLDKSELKKGLKSAQGTLKSFASSIRNIGATFTAAGLSVLAPLTLAVKQFAAAGDAIHKMSKRTGIGAENLQALGHAAELSGADVGTLEKGIKSMNSQLLNLDQGLSTAVDSFDELGLSVDDFKNLTPDKRFELIADRLSGVVDHGRRAALAMRIFGRAGQQLLPMLEDGAEGIEAMKQRFIDLGAVMSQDDVDAAAELTDAMTDLSTASDGIVNTIGAALAPALQSLAEWLTDVVVEVREWIDDNREIIPLIAEGAAITVAFGTALIGLSVAISAVSASLGMLNLFAFLLNPFGLGIALGAVLFGVLLDITGVLDEMISGVGDTFEAVIATIKAGEIEKAWEVLWASLGATAFDMTAAIEEHIAGMLGPLGGFLKDAAKMDRIKASGIRMVRDTAIGGFQRGADQRKEYRRERRDHAQRETDMALLNEQRTRDFERRFAGGGIDGVLDGGLADEVLRGFNTADVGDIGQGRSASISQVGNDGGILSELVNIARINTNMLRELKLGGAYG